MSNVPRFVYDQEYFMQRVRAAQYAFFAGTCIAIIWIYFL